MVTSALAMASSGLPLIALRPLRTLPGVEDLRRVLGHRLRLGDDVGQHLVLDLDGADGVAGLLFGLGRDGGDVVAVVAEGRRRPWRSRSTALTPGIFSAAEMSIDLTLAWAYGL